MEFSHRSKPLKWRAVVLVAALSALCTLAAAGSAQAGFLDFLFGGWQRPTPPPSASSYADPGAAVSRGSEGRVGRGAVAFCVRLCDGQHFPLQHIANATPVDTCRAMCPASKTKVFFGSALDRAVARDGERYADLDNAYIYREHLVADCTCNGKNALGLARIDVKTDPTLRPGDIVATDAGLISYNGRRGGETAEFSPVDPSTLSAAIPPKPARVRLSRRSADASFADGEPGTVVSSGFDPTETDLRGQVER